MLKNFGSSPATAFLNLSFAGAINSERSSGFGNKTSRRERTDVTDGMRLTPVPIAAYSITSAHIDDNGLLRTVVDVPLIIAVAGVGGEILLRSREICARTLTFRAPVTRARGEEKE